MQSRPQALAECASIPARRAKSSWRRDTPIRPAPLRATRTIFAARVDCFYKQIYVYRTASWPLDYAGKHLRALHTSRYRAALSLLSCCWARAQQPAGPSRKVCRCDSLWLPHTFGPIYLRCLQLTNKLSATLVPLATRASMDSEVVCCSSQDIAEEEKEGLVCEFGEVARSDAKLVEGQVVCRLPSDQNGVRMAGSPCRGGRATLAAGTWFWTMMLGASRP